MGTSSRTRRSPVSRRTSGTSSGGRVTSPDVRHDGQSSGLPSIPCAWASGRTRSRSPGSRCGGHRPDIAAPGHRRGEAITTDQEADFLADHIADGLMRIAPLVPPEHWVCREERCRRPAHPLGRTASGTLSALVPRTISYSIHIRERSREPSGRATPTSSGSSPNPDALLRLSACVLIEAHDEWQDSDRRYLSEKSMAMLQPPEPTAIDPRRDTPSQAVDQPQLQTA